MEENTQVKKEEAEILENAQQNGEKKWKKYVRIGFLLLVAVFLIRYFYKNYDSYKNLDIEINWPVLTMISAPFRRQASSPAMNPFASPRFVRKLTT